MIDISVLTLGLGVVVLLAILALFARLEGLRIARDRKLLDLSFIDYFRGVTVVVAYMMGFVLLVPAAIFMFVKEFFVGLKRGGRNGSR